MKITWIGILAFAATAVMGCAQTGDDEGSAQISVRALSLASVVALDVSVTGAGISTPVVGELFQQADGTWSALLGRIPVGTGRTFTASAYDTGERTNRIYSGSVTDVTISATSVANVIIVLQETTPSSTFANHAPVVDGLVVSTTNVSSGDKIALRLTAHDPDQGENAGLTFTPVAACGSFATPTVTTDASGNLVWANQWTAPPTAGPCLLSIEIADPHGAEAIAAVTIQVTAAQDTGGARVDTLIESYPVITNVTSTPVAPAESLVAGGSSRLAVIAIQPDQESMTFAWSSDCDGVFSDRVAQSPLFTLSADSAALTCTFTVVASSPSKTGSDGQSKQVSTTGSLMVSVGATAPPVAVGGPVIDFTLQSTEAVDGGGVVILYVRAHENNSGAVLSAYSWSASDGTLATPENPPDLGFSQVSWTAPPSMSGPVNIIVTVTDSQGATASYTFTIESATPLYPVIDNMTSVPTDPAIALQPGGSVTLDVAAREPTGGAMTYAWSTDCDGLFNSVSSRSPLFTLDANSTAVNCTFTVIVSGPPRPDGYGHSEILTTSGALTVNVGTTPPQSAGGPEIDLASQSLGEAKPGQVVTLMVRAHETKSGASLSSYTWGTLYGTGTLGQPSTATDLSSSTVEWTAPVGMAASETITVVVLDSQGATASYGFLVTQAP